MDGSAETAVSGARSARPRDDLARLCGDVAKIFRRAWGRGPAKTTAHWAGPNMLVILLENGHTDAEKALRAAGHIQQLLGGRRLLQTMVEDELKASVERTIGRSVETMLSATRLDPDLSAEIFLLAAPGPERQPEAAEDSLFDRATHAADRAHDLADDAHALDAQHRQLQKKIAERRDGTSRPRHD